MEEDRSTEEEYVGKNSDKRRRVIQEGWQRYKKFLERDSFEEQMGTSPKRDIDYLSPKREEDKRDGDQATLMVATKENQEAEPLHDLTYVGIDTCSARSISCDPKDFIDLQMLSRKRCRRR